MPTPIDPPAAPTTKYIVDDSPLKASFITFLSLMFFGLMLAGAVLRLASAHDLNGIRALMMRDDTIGWAITFWTVIGAPAWLWIRSKRSWFKKTRDVEIADASPIAKLKSEVVAESAFPLPPPTRPREMKTRLVDPIILHRGGPLPAMPPEEQPIILYDTGAQTTAIADKLGEVSTALKTALTVDGAPTSYEADRDAIQDTVDRALAPSTPMPPVNFLETSARKVAFRVPTVVTTRHMDQFLHGLPVDGADEDEVSITSFPGFERTFPAPRAVPVSQQIAEQLGEKPAVPAPKPAGQTFADVEREHATSGSQESIMDYLDAKGWKWNGGTRSWVGPGSPPPADED